MFNDVLTLEQCKKLLEELSETALPFQCAHGRSVCLRWRISPMQPIDDDRSQAVVGANDRCGWARDFLGGRGG